MSSASLKKEEAHNGRGAGGGGSWRDSQRRDTDRRSSHSNSYNQASGDGNVKREERSKREYNSTHNSTHNSDDRTSTSLYKRAKTEASSFSPPSSHTSLSSSQPSPPPPPPAPKESINLGLSGKLAAHANTTTGGSILKYQPPADAAQPTLSYRLYCFPSSTASPTSAAPPLSPQPPLYIHSQSLYRIGRDPLVNDLVISHHSISKQHAVLQYRRPAHTAAGSGGGGGGGGGVRLYVLDVGSVNGTVLNGERVEVARFVEVRERDVLVFGQCGREYVLLHGESRPVGGGGGEERKEAVSGGRGKKEEGGGEKKRPAWADDDDDDV